MNSETVRFVSKRHISKHLSCSICTEVFYKPTRTRCGHIFCEPCITSWLSSRTANRQSCPQCRQNCKRKDVTRDLLASNLISELEVHCSYSNCGWKGAYSARVSHESSCDCNPVNLPEWLKEEGGARAPVDVLDSDEESDEEELEEGSSLSMRLWRRLASDPSQRDKFSSFMTHYSSAPPPGSSQASSSSSLAPSSSQDGPGVRGATTRSRGQDACQSPSANRSVRARRT